MTGGSAPNNRVTTQEFYQAQLQQIEKMDKIERRIVTRLDYISECVTRQDERIKKNATDIDVIQAKQEKNDLWTKIIGGATGLLTVVLTYLGLSR
jgi:hypothetical protein